MYLKRGILGPSWGLTTVVPVVHSLPSHQGSLLIIHNPDCVLSLLKTSQWFPISFSIKWRLWKAHYQLLVIPSLSFPLSIYHSHTGFLAPGTFNRMVIPPKPHFFLGGTQTQPTLRLGLDPMGWELKALQIWDLNPLSFDWNYSPGLRTYWSSDPLVSIRKNFSKAAGKVWVY